MKVTRLAKLRLNKELSQEELAALSGVSRLTIVRVENGYDVRLSTLKKLSSVLGDDVKELLWDDSDKT